MSAQFITSTSGDEMVVLSRSDYDRLVLAAKAASEEAEDAADAALANEILARIRSGAEETVSLSEAKLLVTRNPSTAPVYE
jgi:hypothetical protein